MRTKHLIHKITTGVIGLALIANALPAAASSHWVTVNAGDLLKLPDDGNPSTNIDTAVYYFGADGLRYVFPNSNTYLTWYTDFSNVKAVSMEQLGTIGIGGNVTYRPGSKMIKIDSDPKTYAIDRGGARRHVTSEAVAIALFGSNWNTKVHDMPDSFFSNYRDGSPIEAANDFDPAAALSENPTISLDKDLRAPAIVTLQNDGTFSPANVNVGIGRTVRFKNMSGATMRVASNPHPAHNALPGFDSAFIPAGLDYVYRFPRAGTWGFHNHSSPSNTGTVTVQ